MLLKLKNSDMEDFVKYGKILLAFIGNWPVNKSKWYWLYKIYRNLYSRVVSVLFFISLTVYLYQSSHDFEKFARAAYFCVTNYSSLFKFLMLSKKQALFVKILNDLDNDLFDTHNLRHREIVAKWLGVSNFYGRQYNLFCWVAVLCFLLYPFLDTSDEWKLPIEMWLPFNIQASVTAYICGYLTALAVVMLCCSIGLSFDVLPNVFMNISCAQMEILKDNIENATFNVCGRESTKFISLKQQFTKIHNFEYYEPLQEKDNDKLEIILTKCIKHHDAIMRLLEDVENVFNPGLLVMFLANGVTLCMIGLQLLTIPFGTAEFASAIMYLLLIIIQLFLFCWCGHQVIIQSSTIGDSCYNMEWYRCSTKIKQIIFIIMERCKKPLKIKAGGIFVLSIMTFTSLLRTSYQYFTVMRTAYNN